MSKLVLVAAGTAGHINAAKAIGNSIEERLGIKPLYMTGVRPLDLKLFKGYNTIHFESSTLRGTSKLKQFSSLLSNLKVFFYCLTLFISNRPKVVFGAGGYVSGPVLMAAFVLGIPMYILEQNSIAGLTNRILGLFATKVFVHFSNTRKLDLIKGKSFVVGNPVRKEFLTTDFSMPHVGADDVIRILIFGGSLGADSINKMVSKLVLRHFGVKLDIVHQIGAGKEVKISSISSSITYNQKEYLDDIATEYKNAHLIICRSGASSVAEMRLVGRPCILIPYPHATDNHQYFNAWELKKSAKFPVKVCHVEEIENNDFCLLQEMIDDIKLKKVQINNNFNGEAQLGAEELIWREIKNDLWP